MPKKSLGEISLATTGSVYWLAARVRGVKCQPVVGESQLCCRGILDLLFHLSQLAREDGMFSCGGKGLL